MEVLINGLNLFYTDSGPSHAAVVVCIHGFPFDHTQWQEQEALLSSSFRVITYDQRGHGRSDVGDGQYLFEHFVDDLFGLLDALHIHRAILCGLSMGGYVALRAAEREPERVQGLILCDTRSESDSNEAKIKRAFSLRTIRTDGIPVFAEAFLKSIFAPSSFKENPVAVEQIRKVMVHHTTIGLCGSLIALATRNDTTASLSAIHVPTLILVGDQDGITPVAAAQAMQERIPGSFLAIIPNAGHLSNIENPPLFNQAILRFLNTFK